MLFVGLLSGYSLGIGCFYCGGLSYFGVFSCYYCGVVVFILGFRSVFCGECGLFV